MRVGGSGKFPKLEAFSTAKYFSTTTITRDFSFIVLLAQQLKIAASHH